MYLTNFIDPNKVFKQQLRFRNFKQGLIEEIVFKRIKPFIYWLTTKLNTSLYINF